MNSLSGAYRDILRSPHFKKRSAFAAIVLLAFVYAIGLGFTGSIEDIENRTWDWRVKLSVEPGRADSRIKIIEVTQDSLDRRERDGITWPWPREIYAAVLQYLAYSGAKGVAFDVLFTEQSSYGPKDDEAFVSAMTGTLPVVSAVVLSREQRIAEISESTDDLDFFRSRQLALNYSGSFSALQEAGVAIPEFPSITLPIPSILDKSAGFGNVSAFQDSDGIFRHYLFGGKIAGVPVLNLPFALYRATGGDPFNDIDLGRYVDRFGRLTLHFQSPHGSYSPTDINLVIDSFVALQSGEPPPLDPSYFKDSWVLIGLSATGLMDLRPTPLDRTYKGVEYNAVVLDNLVHRNFVRRTSLAVDTIYTLLFVMTTVGATFFLPSAKWQILVTACSFALMLLSSYLLALNGYWVAFAIPMTATIGALVLGYAVQYWLEGRQHKFIKDAFRFYVSPSVIDQIVDNPETLSLGGEKRELSLFFSDIAGFTSISERIEANKLVALLNRFLTEMTGVIMRAEGTVDKYVGDAIVAFWNAPLRVPDHAYKAVRAALECQAKIRELQPMFEKEFGVLLKMRIGLNTGVVNVGNFGSKERFNYTVVGDAANLASRLEGANKYFGTLTLMSGTTHKALNGLIDSRKVADIKVVGKSEVISVYEPLESRAPEATQVFEVFQRGMTLYDQGDLREALKAFKRIPEDAVAKVYISRIERDLAKGPGPEWTPVWNLSEK